MTSKADQTVRGAGTRRPPTLAEALLQQLREDLIRGRYEAGDPIRVDHVAAASGTSALPVREALRVLMAEGRVQYEAHRGYRVTTLTPDDVEEIFLICGLLEGEALSRGVPSLDQDGIDRIRRALAMLESPPDSASVWDMVSVHQEFHFVPFEYAGLPRVEAELRRLWDHTDHYRPLYLFGDPATVDLMNRDHRAIADACAARDADRAIALLGEHRRRALEAAALDRAAAGEHEGTEG